MKSSSRKLKQNVWKEHSELWKASGLTKLAYCEQEGISYRSFVYHHNRLMRPPKKVPLNFIEAKSEPAVIIGQAVGLQLILPNGIRIGIGADINPLLLKTVLTVAGAVPC